LSSAIQKDSSLYQKAFAKLSKFQLEPIDAFKQLEAELKLFLEIVYYSIAIRSSMKANAMNSLIFIDEHQLFTNLLFIDSIE
jgi:hypothetical protein